LPKSPLGEALGYANNQRSRLELFLTDARIPIHNNSSERRLRVVALGRKNYLFVGHARAGRNIAGLYSLVGGCIANGVEPTEYLIDVLPRIAGAKSDEEIDGLLPERWRPNGPAPKARFETPDNHGGAQTVTSRRGISDRGGECSDQQE
jgi:transposase